VSVESETGSLSSADCGDNRAGGSRLLGRNIFSRCVKVCHFVSCRENPSRSIRTTSFSTVSNRLISAHHAPRTTHHAPRTLRTTLDTNRPSGQNGGMLANAIPFDPVLNFDHASRFTAVAWVACWCLATLIGGWSLWMPTKNERSRRSRLGFRIVAVLLVFAACGISFRDHGQYMKERIKIGRQEATELNKK
jgi:hypothetical protein